MPVTFSEASTRTAVACRVRSTYTSDCPSSGERTPSPFVSWSRTSRIPRCRSGASVASSVSQTRPFALQNVRRVRLAPELLTENGSRPWPATLDQPLPVNTSAASAVGGWVAICSANGFG